MLSNSQNNTLKYIAQNFKLANSEILNLYFIDVTNAKSNNPKIKQFIKANLNANSKIILISDEVGMMSNDEIALYPLDPTNLAVLTNTNAFGVDSMISQNIKDLIKLLNKNNINNLNIDTVFIASDDLDI